jgi:uncharacterized damage-inducible protein DinB
MNYRGRRDEAVASTEELTLLTAFLDDLRETILWKLDGVSSEAARASVVPSGTSLLGMTKHLGFVERYWFQARFAGREVAFPWSEEDPDADWRTEGCETPEGVADFYRAEAERSREVVAAAQGLDTLAARGKPVTLRWILLHMIEETARHAGHADLLREAADGAIGE